uniref:Glycosyltransferase n=1 Tax=Gardenia jasminoides TaxID=114476 RepID=F8WKW7_GARJA|nr:UDP-glucose glucosyltransferase [Gardenia jasminoides]
MKKPQHFLITSLAAQGHINPTLQLAKSLARNGAQVTFATTVYGLSCINSTLPRHNGLSYASFSDGNDDKESIKKRDRGRVFHDLKQFGSQNVRELIKTLSAEGRPVTCVIYTILLPWVAEVAFEMQIPSVFLVIQCATVFAIYHRYFNSQDGVYDGVREIDPSISVQFPDLPLFSSRDLPTIIVPSDPYFAYSAPVIHEHIKVLEKDTTAFVLVNTFDELEQASVRAITNMNVIPIGPLVPSAFSDGTDLTDKSVGGDLFDSSSRDYLQWLDSKPECSVVYVSFGSLATLKKEQKIEIFHGLEEAGWDYLMVIRKSDNEDQEVKEMMENGLNGKGMIVPWCSQMEVLCHKSIGCFITHCGWNSTLESLIAGVPIVGCAQFSDQMTNIKLIEEVWGNGVRAKANEAGVVEREEIKRCLGIVMGCGEKEEKIRRNAAKWRGLAVDAVKENGSSHNNLKLFLESLG